MKILVADDERMICEWLQFCIQQYQGCELVGCAHNGEQALELFRQKGADVIFTDIRMPVMDGIELLEAVKALAPETIVIFLTAYAEFDLAREAVRKGGSDYLLKTEMNNQTFREILHKLEQKVSNHMQSNQEIAETESTGQQHSIISDILRTGSSLTDDDIRRLKECNIRWRDQGLFAVAVWKKRMLEDFVLPKHQKVHHVVGVEYDDFLYVIVGNLARDLTELEKSQILYEYTSSIAYQNQCITGVSGITESLRRISDAILQAAVALAKGYYDYKKMKVLQTEKSGQKIREEEANMDNYLRKQKHQLYHIQDSEFYNQMEKVMEECKKNALTPISKFAKFCCDAMELAYVRFAAEEAGLMHFMLNEEKKFVKESVVYEETKMHVLEFIKSLLPIQKENEKKLSKSVELAVDYVKKHYSEPISLESVSQEVHLSTEYLSRIFKEEMGCTYSAFLSETRLKQAAYLLSHTSERVQKIAESVGYPNVSYFSTTFKKRYGVNPYEYRRNE